jgi:hypothetical protein
MKGFGLLGSGNDTIGSRFTRAGYIPGIAY